MKTRKSRTRSAAGYYLLLVLSYSCSPYIGTSGIPREWTGGAYGVLQTDGGVGTPTADVPDAQLVAVPCPALLGADPAATLTGHFILDTSFNGETYTLRGAGEFCNGTWAISDLTGTLWQDGTIYFSVLHSNRGDLLIYDARVKDSEIRGLAAGFGTEGLRWVLHSN